MFYNSNPVFISVFFIIVAIVPYFILLGCFVYRRIFDNKQVKYWKIEIENYGILYIRGTREQSKAWRLINSNWRHSKAKKREIKISDMPPGKIVYDLNKIT